MPRACETCRHYTADESVLACPGCGSPLKFTLLPPAGVDPIPLAPADEPSPLRRYERDATLPSLPSLHGLVTNVNFLAVVGVALFVVLLGLLSAGIQQGQQAQMPKPR